MGILKKVTGLLSRFAGIDQTTPWRSIAIIGVVLGIIGFVYEVSRREEKPKMVLEVSANTPVVDIKEGLPALNVFFGGVDIRQQNKALNFITVKVINDSKVGILRDRYDSHDPLGFHVSSGQIITADVPSASNEYLRKTAHVTHDTSNVFLPEVSLDGAQYYVVRLLVVIPVSNNISISAIGHVEGVGAVVIREPYRDAGKQPFWAEVLAGTTAVQAVRTVFYTMCFLLLVVFVAAAGSMLGPRSESRKRHRDIELFKAATMVTLNGSEEWIFDEYLANGAKLILAMRDVAVDETLVGVAFHIFSHGALPPGKVAEYEIPASVGWFLTEVRARQCFEEHLITVESGKPIVNKHYREVLDALVRFMFNKRILTDNDSPVPDSRIHIYGDRKDMLIQVTHGTRTYGMRIPGAQTPMPVPLFKTFVEVDGVHNATIVMNPPPAVPATPKSPSAT